MQLIRLLGAVSVARLISPTSMSFCKKRKGGKGGKRGERRARRGGCNVIGVENEPRTEEEEEEATCVDFKKRRKTDGVPNEKRRFEFRPPGNRCAAGGGVGKEGRFTRPLSCFQTIPEDRGDGRRRSLLGAGEGKGRIPFSSFFVSSTLFYPE